MTSNPIKLGVLFYLVLSLTTTAFASPQTEALGQFLTLPTVEGFLLVCGGVFLLIAALTMGAAVAEVACFTSFTLLFAGRYLQGEDLWLPLGLLVLGVAFVLMEVFVVPGFGVFGAMGFIALGTMSVLVMGSPQVGLAVFFMTTIGSVIAGFLVIRFLPHMVIAKKFLILEPPSKAGPAETLLGSFVPAVGEVGVSASSLRPQGVVLFGKERIDVLTESEFVPKGQAVEVIRVEGSRVVVRSNTTSS